MAAPHLPLAAGGDSIQAPVPDWVNGQVVTVGVASAQSASIIQSCVTLISTTNCWVKWGANPTAVAATAGNLYLPAGTPWTVGNRIGKYAVIQDTAGGFLVLLPAIED